MFNVTFLKRLGEEAAHAFIGGFAAAALTGDLGSAALVGAATAGVRGVLGVLVRNFGDKDKPSVS